MSDYPPLLDPATTAAELQRGQPSYSGYSPNSQFEPGPPADPGDAARRLRAYIARHDAERAKFLRRSSDAIQIADALAELASTAYRVADHLADAAGFRGAVIGRLRRDAAHCEADAERALQQRRGAP